MKPRFAPRCASNCEDSKGLPRSGTEWIHIDGETRWVCHSCAESIGSAHGILTTAQTRRNARKIEAQLQMHIDEAFLAECVEESVGGEQVAQ